MPQSDGNTRLKRMEFVFKGKSYTFSVNPEEYTQEEPSRSTVTQTKGGAWVDDFGAGLPTITIRGSTGFKHGQGFTKFKELRDLIRKYYKEKTELTFHNWTDDESWIVHTDPSGFRLMRSKTNPLLYMYDIRLICLRPATHPHVKDVSVINKNLGSALPNAPKAQSASLVENIQPFVQTQLNTSERQPPIVALNLLQKIKVNHDGRVQDTSSVQGVNAYDLSFSPYVSPLAVSALLRYRSAPNIRTVTADADTLTAQLITLEQQKASPQILNAFRMVLLEAVALWEQAQVDPTQIPLMASEGDLDRASQNAYWLSEQLKTTDFTMTHNLRWLGRVFQTIKTSGIYSKDYQTAVGDLNDVLR